MKKALTVLLVCLMALSMTACGRESWTDEDFVFTGSDKITVKEGNSFIVYEDVSYLTNYEAASWEEYDEEYATSRGLELGMELKDYLKLYPVVKGYALWELFTGENNEYTSFAEYNKEDPAKMYDDANNVWLDLGFHKVNGKWVQLKDYEVQDIWFCDADMDAYGEVVVFAVNFDEDGEVIGISLEHFDYDEDWAVWQDWAE